MSSRTSIDDRITQTNQRLKLAQLGLLIERRGQQLNLRGTLPPKPNSVRQRPHQQRISLGLAATPEGLKQAEQTAKVVAAQLIQKTFDWQQYLRWDGGLTLTQMDLAQQIEVFAQQFRENAQGNSHPASVRTTWQTAYAPYLKQLVTIAQAHPYRSLAELILATVRSTHPNSRSRQLCCTALHAFAQFLSLDLPFDFKTLSGNYGPSRTQQRTLPTDEAILQAFSQIPNPAWRFVYGVMATYGLRNHEVFFCDYSRLEHPAFDPVIEILETTKTGSHEAWPFYPEWVDQFNLRTVQLPAIDLDLNRTTLQRIGQRVTSQFRRYGIPFAPYSLRHAWAVRTIHFGLPDSVAARMMGHSIAVHTRTYQRWLTRRDQAQAVSHVLQNDRPIAPVLESAIASTQSIP